MRVVAFHQMAFEQYNEWAMTSGLMDGWNNSLPKASILDLFSTR
jgi:hypothetical protein